MMKAWQVEEEYEGYATDDKLIISAPYNMNIRCYSCDIQSITILNK